jgi:hypothetical protein
LVGSRSLTVVAQIKEEDILTETVVLLHYGCSACLAAMNDDKYLQENMQYFKQKLKVLVQNIIGKSNYGRRCCKQEC